MNEHEMQEEQQDTFHQAHAIVASIEAMLADRDVDTQRNISDLIKRHLDARLAAQEARADLCSWGDTRAFD